MKESINYISDEALEQLICQVELNELVAAPPDLTEHILAALEASEQTIPEVVPVKTTANRKKEFYAYCFRVITSVAAAVVLVFLLPEISGWIGQRVSLPEDHRYAIYQQEAPHYEDIVGIVPDKEEILAAKSTPTKEEVLNYTGFFNKVLQGTAWFGNGKSDN